MCQFERPQSELMPSGLMNAPPTFAGIMVGLLGSLSFAKLYLEEVIVFSAGMETQLRDIKQIITKVADHWLKIKVSKCDFSKKQLVLLNTLLSSTERESRF